MNSPAVEKPLYNGLTHAPASLPGSYYTDTAQHTRELEKIWYQEWVYLCRAETLEGPLAYRTFELGTQPILLLRDGDGTLRAFHNVCRHRGSLLCSEPSGRLSAKLLVCPYHSWSYRLDGQLQRVTSKYPASDFDKSDYPLHRIAVQEWRGFIFINLKGDRAAPFCASFDLDSGNLDNWPLESLRAVHATTKILECNWKIFWENFSECLHCPGTHPELCDLVPIYKRAFQDERDDPHWQDHSAQNDPAYKGGLRPGALTWTLDGAPHGPVFAQLSETERAAGQTYIIKLPAMMMAGHIDYVRVIRMRPLGPKRTELYVEWLFSPEAIAADDFDPDPAIDFTNLVMDQDAALCALNQKGLESAAFRTGVLMPEEYVVHQFHQYIRNAMET